MSNVETLRLGNEYDDDLRDALAEVLTEMSGQKESSDWAMAGSQELQSVRLKVAGQALLVESETYIGLTITGEPSLIQDIAGRVDRSMKAAGRGSAR